MLVALFFLFINTKAISQATTATGTNGPINPLVEYLGWNALTNEALNIKHEANQQIRFYTNSGPGTLNNLKMRIGRRLRNNNEHAAVMIQSRGINNIVNPRAILQLGINYPFAIGGWREWIDVGTFNTQQSDFAYFGLMQHIGDTTETILDHHDAVIVWGDNINQADAADNLRVIFNSPLGL